MRKTARRRIIARTTMASYSITVSMSAETVSQLRANGYVLFGLNGVQTTSPSGSPLIWFSVDNYLEQNQLAWQDNFQAYISTDQIVPGGVILDAEAVDIDLGETAVVAADGTMSVSDEGPDNAITVQNQSGSQWTSGVSQQFGGDDINPIFATPLFANMAILAAPSEQVLLMFASMPMPAGTVVTTCAGTACLIDLSQTQSVPVTFDIVNGWSWDDGAPVSSIDAGTDLQSVLIQPMASAG
jgi:hypothetical protein